jgi:SAM-dependent methyltransferase
VFLASQKVGSEGRAIGIDMTSDMVDRARRAAATGVDGVPFSNVEFHLASIDRMPLRDGIADVVISNCVINLAPDKRAVFREMFRVLKPGGRVAVSDIALKKPLPPEIADDVMAHVGCIAGAISIEDYADGLRDAGFGAVAVVDSHADLNAYSKVQGQSGCCSPTSSSASSSSCCSGTGHQAKAAVHDHIAKLLARYDINAYAASVKVFAIKPAE